MANLKYKTRGNSSPQGKPRVYFCCHLEDFGKCFETISNEILAKQNCAIWYTDKALIRNDAFLDNLKQMQLFVMPVTTNLLCTENETLDIEFKFAIENHIPVLPLMQEGGLEKLFNKKCGELQILDKNNTDATSISYDEKLKRYLESVLIGEELTEKIRAAFDAYVFLSYRKKDRRYAQELMRLIHKNEFCRDIAIWYDEFLTPGENFNDSIKEAIQKSGLFVLTVTPNLINEPNYIMTTEYPMAKQEGKPILPAELVSTDREQLSEKYEDIPNPADAHNETEFSEALLESIKKMAIKENDNSPEHNYFIGLAYLDGVDVEIDNEKAVSLITSAAESGLVEAMRYLVMMYEKGKGVSVDYACALKWQCRIMNLLFERFTQQETVESFSAYFQATWNYICELTSFDGSKPYAYGASKVLWDCILFIREIEKKINQYYKDRTTGYKELIECLDNDEMMQVLMKSIRMLESYGGRFLPRTWLMYRSWLDSRGDEISPSQATIRHLLSICAEYAGNPAESMQYRAEAEQILLKISSESNQDIDKLRSKCFIELK
jgi:hypothetical protein